jgi:hypothetical protein
MSNSSTFVNATLSDRPSQFVTYSGQWFNEGAYSSKLSNGSTQTGTLSSTKAHNANVAIVRCVVGLNRKA